MPTATTPKPLSKRAATKAKVAQTKDSFVGKRVPSFSMPATKLGKISSGALKGKAFLLYFYPKDDTSGCTAEACAFRDAMPNFAKANVMVIGVSKDDLNSHEKFSKKYNLSFPLISDTTGDLCEKFGVWKQKSMYGRQYMGVERSSFLVDGKGIIRAVWRKVNGPAHAEEVKAAIAEL